MAVDEDMGKTDGFWSAKALGMNVSRLGFCVLDRCPILALEVSWWRPCTTRLNGCSCLVILRLLMHSTTSRPCQH